MTPLTLSEFKRGGDEAAMRRFQSFVIVANSSGYGIYRDGRLLDMEPHPRTRDEADLYVHSDANAARMRWYAENAHKCYDLFMDKHRRFDHSAALFKALAGEP